jgi:hypothetical protein
VTAADFHRSIALRFIEHRQNFPPPRNSCKTSSRFNLRYIQLEFAGG